MARTVEGIIKDQLGGLLTEVAVLTAQKEALAEENAKLKEELKTRVREPDNQYRKKE